MTNSEKENKRWEKEELSELRISQDMKQTLKLSID